MAENPFNEPEDDRTVLRPRPGGRRPVAPLGPTPRPPEPPADARPSPRPVAAAPATPRRPAAAAPPPEPAAADLAELTANGLSPLLVQAAPLLQLLARLRNTARAPDAGDLHARAASELGAFGQRAEQAGIAKDILRTGHYALCASIDDVALNTPWGAGGGWPQPLTQQFHPEIKGDRFFDLLERISRDPARFLPALELMFLCLSLGYQGQTRDAPRGAEELAAVRARAHGLIAAQAEPPPAGLSATWEGVAAPYKPVRGGLPVWVVGAAALAVIAGLFVWTSSSLNAASDAVFGRVLHAAPERMPALARAVAVPPPPPPPAPAEPAALDRLRAALKPEIDRGALGVLGTDAVPAIRIPARLLFAPGTATLLAGARPLLERASAALKEEPGSLSVVAYTDNAPIHTVKFGSGFQLSTAQAAAAAAAVAHGLGGASRVASEGRADADPVAPNGTAENRELNRRLELVLHRPQ